MLYLYGPKRIKSLLRVCILASAGLPEPPLVDDHGISNKILFVCLFVWLVALRPMSTAMVIAGRSVHLTTLFPGHA